MKDVAESSGGAYATLGVKNFGPIALGEVELRPLTVFSGRSDTGKSWFASLIYALFKSRHSYNPWLQEIADIAENPSISYPENPASWAAVMEKDNPVELSDSDRRILKQVLEGANRIQRRDEILRCFGLSRSQDLVRNGSEGGMRIEVRYPSSSKTTEPNYCLMAGNRENSEEWKCEVDLSDSMLLNFSKYMYNNKRMQDYLDISSDETSQHDHDSCAENKRIMLEATLRVLLFENADYVWYLPADRGGIMHSHQVIVSSLIQNAARSGIDMNSRGASLSGILADFLENLVALSNERSMFRGLGLPDKAAFESELARNMEENLLGGRVKIEKTAVNFPRFTWIPADWKAPLALANASTMISELVPLVLYLRHCVQKGDVLILEEPEAHLHPEAHVGILRQAADWARAGIRVVLTTHSDWVIHELSNVVGETRESPGEGLAIEDVGLWRFVKQSRKGGSAIEEIPWVMENGGYDTGYMDVAANQQNRWADIAGDDE